MKDINGRKLNVGDRVVFIAGASRNPILKIGTITKIYENNKECSVDGNAHVYNNRVMLVEDGILG